MAELRRNKRKIANMKTKIENITTTGRHFSKISLSYKFNNDATSYLSWVIRFKAEVNNYNLGKVLMTDPESIGSSGINDPIKHKIQCQQQKTVYHMILRCVPTEALLVVTNSLPLIKQTGYGAFRALREFYIGEERAYVIYGQHSKLNLIRWSMISVQLVKSRMNINVKFV
jgi:hypothetical protein